MQERDELQRSKDKIVLQGHTPPKEEEAFFLKNATKQLKALEKAGYALLDSYIVESWKNCSKARQSTSMKGGIVILIVFVLDRSTCTCTPEVSDLVLV